MTHPYDSGLTNERTSLSWIRTALSLGVAGAFAVRITLEELGLLGIIIGLVGIILALAAAAIASWRYRRSVRDLYATGNLGSDGKVLALSSASAILIGLLAVVFVLNWIFVP